MMKASIVYFPNESKPNLKTGKIPIYMRICYKRAKAESRFNVEITFVELLVWDTGIYFYVILFSIWLSWKWNKP